MSDLFGGLDLSDLDGITDREHKEFRAFYQQRFGHIHRGLTYLLDTRPDALKRFRLYVKTGTDPYRAGRAFGFGFLLEYALAGYQVGVRYAVRQLNRLGLSREECLDGFAVCALYCGPRGLETIARALDDYAWVEPENPYPFPTHWSHNPAQLASGIDFTTPELSAEEEKKVRDWYVRTLGEVPRYVDFLAAHQPEMLKVYRNRFETCLKVLPNQVLPFTLIHFNATRANVPGIRENVLLARGLGMTKGEALQAVMSGMYAGIEAISVVDEAVRDVFDSWLAS